MGVRFPRLIVGILAGGCLAMAGLVLQTMTKNPLASAGTLGINAGAYLFVVIGTLFFPGVNASFLFFVFRSLFCGFSCLYASWKNDVTGAGCTNRYDYYITVRRVNKQSPAHV